MNTKNEMTRLTIDIPKSMHKRLKTFATLSGKSMREIFIELIDSMDMCLKSEHIPNDKTRKSIESSMNEKNLVKAENLKDLFKKLGI